MFPQISNFQVLSLVFLNRLVADIFLLRLSETGVLRARSALTDGGIDQGASIRCLRDKTGDTGEPVRALDAQLKVAVQSERKGITFDV